VNEEILAFKRLGREDRIFCLIVDGEPQASEIAGRETEECLPPALRVRYDAHGRPTSQRIDPVAADVRRGGDGKGNAKLKIVAGLLGVAFDALKQREHHRRFRHLVAVTSLAVAVTTLMTVLAVDALIERKAAERRQKQAESLVNFMLGDLADKLRQVQRLINDLGVNLAGVEVILRMNAKMQEMEAEMEGLRRELQRLRDRRLPAPLG